MQGATLLNRFPAEVLGRSLLGTETTDAASQLSGSRQCHGAGREG